MSCADGTEAYIGSLLLSSQCCDGDVKNRTVVRWSVSSGTGSLCNLRLPQVVNMTTPLTGLRLMVSVTTTLTNRQHSHRAVYLN